MINEKRVNEIVSRITAFSKDTYTKSEFLPELLKLQKELIDLTFNVEHAENGDLQLWDVEKHLCKINDERGHVADDELARFIKGSKVVRNNISTEISGNAGEKIVFNALEQLRCQNGILHNVELEFDGRRTEIDAIVFTNRAIFIIEIKNSKKDIFIDENGEFYRIGNSMHHDCNIAAKMNNREALLRKALERTEIEPLKIFKILAFTNQHIDVECKYHYIKVCPSAYLPSFIEKFTSDQWYSLEKICTMMEAVTEVRCQEEYRMSIDMTEFKTDFALLIAKLEAAEDADHESEIVKEETKEHVKVNDAILKNKIIHKYGSKVAAVVGVTLLSAAFIGISRLSKKER